MAWSAHSSNAVWNVPFYPAGSVDGKVTTAAAAAEMSLSARFGRADGVLFDAADFLNKQVTRIYALNTGAGVR